jgi:CRP-like cAMP-binding protein
MKMQKSSVKSLLKNTCSIALFRKGLVLYKEEDESKDIFILVYGSLKIWSKKNGSLGKVISGFTAGEESLLDSNYVCRLDNCITESESCAFTIQTDDWIKYKRGIDPKEAALLKDIASFENTLNRNYIIKKGWKSVGIPKLI